MSTVYLDLGASAAFGDACVSTGRSSSRLADEARSALTAGLLDTSAADVVAELAETLDLLSRSIDEITAEMQAADSQALFGGIAAQPYTAQLQAKLAGFGRGGGGKLLPMNPIDDLTNDPAKLAKDWPNLSDEQKRQVAVALTAQGSVLPEQKRVKVLVDAWKAKLSSEDLEKFYFDVALTKAGIDITQWDPSKGYAANADIVDKVYKYYGDLFASDPKKYVWAGMAALIGPSFIAGMRALPEFAKLLQDPVVRQGLKSAGIWPPGASEVAEFTAAELRWFESKFLSMQKEIFFDMAAKHEAFIDGGADQVERMMAHDQTALKSETIQAFRDMENGVNLNAAGKTLLLREQREIIRDDWDEMRNRNWPLGKLLTVAMTMIGKASIPGAVSFTDRFPNTSTKTTRIDLVPTPGWPLPEVHIEETTTRTSPFPDGDISNFDDRWKLIEGDTLPKYLDFLEKHPDEAVRLATTSAVKRSDDLSVDVPSVIRDFIDALKKGKTEVDRDVEIKWPWE